MRSEQPHPDSEFKIDGSEVTQVCLLAIPFLPSFYSSAALERPTNTLQLTFIGQIHTISSQATNTTFKLDDGTGLIEVKQWTDSDADPEAAAAALPKEGEYLRVWGRLKAFNNKRHVGAHMIRPVKDFNEINYHLLEATAVHLYFVKGPPENAANGVKTEGGEGMFVGQAAASNGNGAPSGGKGLSAKVSKVGRQVYELLRDAPQNNEGLHVHDIAARLKISSNDAFKAGDELLGDGVIYTTVDDETWAVLEF